MGEGERGEAVQEDKVTVETENFFHITIQQTLINLKKDQYMKCIFLKIMKFQSTGNAHEYHFFSEGGSNFSVKAQIEATMYILQKHFS